MEVWSSENPHPNLAKNARLEWGTRLGAGNLPVVAGKMPALLCKMFHVEHFILSYSYKNSRKLLSGN
jgi:hypothetical protein